MSCEHGIQSFIQQEGIKPVNLPPGVLKGGLLVNASIDLFRHILPDQDPRWSIVNAWTELVRKREIKGIHREVAMGAIYLSHNSSFRNEYGVFAREPNLRQLCRAINNLGADERVKSAFQSMSKHPSLRLAKTDKITLGTRQDGTTGCPEALYQIRFFSEGKEQKYLGRVGFNMHHEQEGWVISITNLQGVPDGNGFYEELKRQETDVFNVLVRSAKDLAYQFNPDIQIRALRNPKDSVYAPLINTVCKRERIERHYFRRH